MLAICQTAAAAAAAAAPANLTQIDRQSEMGIKNFQLFLFFQNTRSSLYNKAQYKAKGKIVCADHHQNKQQEKHTHTHKPKSQENARAVQWKERKGLQ